MSKVMIVFGPAVVAYIMLTLLIGASLLPDVSKARWIAALSRARISLTYAVAFGATVHVYMLWSVWYEWDVSRPFKNGPSMPIYFHTALALVYSAAWFARRARSHLTLYLAWGLLVIGTTPAPFVHPDYLGDILWLMVGITSTGVCIGALWLYHSFQVYRSRRRKQETLGVPSAAAEHT